MCDRSATDLKKNLTASTSHILDNHIIDTVGQNAKQSSRSRTFSK